MNDIFKAAESKFVYVAMFDEIEEGVAIYKSANRREALPDPDNMVHLNIDADKLPEDLQNLPEDWYLQITNEMGKVLSGEREMTEKLPIRP